MESEKQSSKTSPVNTSNSSVPKVISLKMQAEHILQNAILMTELGMDLREKCLIGEKYVCYLRSLAVRAGKTMTTLQSSGRTFLLLAQKLITSAMINIDEMTIVDQTCCNIKLEYERLLNVIGRELEDVEEAESADNSYNTFGALNLSVMSEKIKHLEAKQKLTDISLLPPSSSTKSVKSDVDEKYPENLSRESLIDLNNVVNLPTVPEDMFTCFSNIPIRTSSLFSLKSMRKVKLFLQRASSASDEEDESSEPEEHDLSKFVVSKSIFMFVLRNVICASLIFNFNNVEYAQKGTVIAYP